MKSLRVERRDAIAVLRLDKARGNAIDAAMLEDLIEASCDLASDRSVKAVLLASAHPKLFSPGLDLITLVDLDRGQMEAFMARFGQAMMALYDLPKPMLAAVNGHAVAGGCILALTADYRVLKRGAQIGLNEVKIGVPLPWFVSVLLRASVSPASLARVALLGRNFADEEALRTGLADEIAEADGFETTCLERLQEFAEKDIPALATTKRYLRQDALRAMKAHEDGFAKDFLDGWFSEPTRERLRQIVGSLSAKS
jgi:enoyl-CoA hydratase